RCHGNDLAGDRGDEAEGQRRRGQDRQREAAHTGTSLIGLAVLSTMRIGRPTLDWFCFVGSMPSARQTVARKSVGGTGRSSTRMPSGLVLPMTWPPLMPPPASTVLHAAGKWSRPPPWPRPF